MSSSRRKISLRELAAVAEAKQKYKTAIHFTLYKQDNEIKAMDSGVYAVLVEADTLPDATFLKNLSIKLSQQDEENYKYLKYFQKQLGEQFNHVFYTYNKRGVEQFENYFGNSF